MIRTGIAKGVVQLLAGRWQVPLAVVAATTSAVTLYYITPRRPSINFDSVMADVHALEEAGRFVDAADAAANLLTMEPPLSDDQRLTLHDYLSEIVYRQELARFEAGQPVNEHNAGEILRQLEEAEALGLTPQAVHFLRRARAREWLGADAEAVVAYEQAVAHATAGEPDVRRAALQGIVHLLHDREQRSQWLNALLADEGVSPGYLWWALQEAIGDALAAGDIARAEGLLEQYGARLKPGRLQGYYNFLLAWILTRSGRTDAAEPLLYWVHEWLRDDQVDREHLDAFGSLPARAFWLQGEIHLAEHRPQQALAAFEESLHIETDTTRAADAMLGRGAALNRLERHESARRVLQEGLSELLMAPGASAHARRRFEAAAMELFRDRYRRGDFANAIGYLALATEFVPREQQNHRLDLLEQLGQLEVEAAASAADAGAARRYHLQAARHFEQAADLAEADWAREGTLIWLAAEEFDRAGRIGSERQLLERFVAGASSDPRIPQALLKLGESCEALGDLEAAIGWFARVQRDFPKLEEAVRARVQMAAGLNALGGDRQAEAERLLLDLLENQDTAPDAPAFRDALLTLCNMLYEQGRYADAIARLEDFRRLYPNDGAQHRVLFLLADSYRRSAYQLRAQPPADARAAAVQRVVDERFVRASELFDEFERRLQGDDGSVENAGVYLRLALFYRGDCLFELNNPEALQFALSTYRQAAARYEAEPPALNAQVQIANVYLRLGKPTEAARAIERARWLLRNIPDEVFARYADGTDRTYWDRYLTAMADSELFRGVFEPIR